MGQEIALHPRRLSAKVRSAGDVSHKVAYGFDVRFFHRAGPFPLREIAALVGVSAAVGGR